MRTLIANVFIDPDWWGPAYGNADQVPDDVADKITNPDVWATVDDTPAAPEQESPPAPTRSEVLAEWVAAAPIEAIVQKVADTDPEIRVSYVADILEVAGDRHDEIVAALESGTTPTASDPAATVDDITALDDDALATWLSDHKADEVLAAVGEAIAREDATDDDKATFLTRVITAEAAGKDRKGIAEQLDAIVERLTAPPTTET